jgi:hypothetical protein
MNSGDMEQLVTNVIITTINRPSQAVQLFSAIGDVNLTVVGDKKTPSDWAHSGATYLSTEAQQSLGYAICSLLPYNHYARKNIGYVHAIKSGAEVIVDTDDDNLPMEGWSFPSFVGNFACTARNLGFVNVYRHFTEQHIWPRGFPLELVTPANLSFTTNATAQDVKVGVWQGLADGDPDVDAIYRLVLNDPCIFDDRAPIVLSSGTLCPFNSQNTAFTKAMFPLLYLPSFVSFRFTDILRGLVAQPIMWLSGHLLGFSKATVVQERNPHDYMKDFASEIPCFLHPQEVIEIVSAHTTSSSTVGDNLYRAYDGLSRKGIVDAREMELISQWLRDIE